MKGIGIPADGEMREAPFGHIARTIREAADEHDARIVVLGSSDRTDVPHLPFGSVSPRLLHASRPVLIVPRQAIAQRPRQAAAQTVTS
jgi:nucleotide-binding universal stress UspA family protein